MQKVMQKQDCDRMSTMSECVEFGRKSYKQKGGERRRKEAGIIGPCRRDLPQLGTALGDCLAHLVARGPRARLLRNRPLRYHARPID